MSERVGEMGAVTVRAAVLLMVEFVSVFALTGFASVTARRLVILLSSSSGVDTFLEEFSYKALYMLMMIAIIFVFRRGYGGWSWADLGFKWHDSFHHSLRTGIITFSLIFVLDFPVISLLLPFYAAQFEIFESMIRFAPLVMVLISISSIAPLTLLDSGCEEIFYRGYYQGLLSGSFSSVVGFLAGTFYFSFNHYFAHPDWHIAMVLNTLPTGMILSLVYSETGSLVPCTLAHFLLNAVSAYPIVLYARGDTILAYLTVLLVAIISFIVIVIDRTFVNALIVRGRKIFRDFDKRQMLLTAVFTVFPLGLRLLVTWISS